MTEINDWVKQIIEERKKHGFVTVWSNLPVKAMLIVTEIGRSVDAHREEDKSLVYHELTDALVRLLDLMGSLDMNVDNWLKTAIEEWVTRPYKHGKSY
jgi:hypothetical protein